MCNPVLIEENFNIIFQFPVRMFWLRMVCLLDGYAVLQVDFH